VCGFDVGETDFLGVTMISGRLAVLKIGDNNFIFTLFFEQNNLGNDENPPEINLIPKFFPKVE